MSEHKITVLNNRIDNADYTVFTQYPDVDSISFKLPSSTWRELGQPESLTVAFISTDQINAGDDELAEVEDATEDEHVFVGGF